MVSFDDVSTQLFWLVSTVEELQCVLLNSFTEEIEHKSKYTMNLVLTCH
jgi:hypothetical protein